MPAKPQIDPGFNSCGRAQRCADWELVFPSFQPIRLDSHRFSTTIGLGYIQIIRILLHNSCGDFCPSMANPGDFAYTVKQQADIVRIIGDYIKLKKAGAQNYSGLCPFHGEKTASFSVHATKQFFHCFGCGVSGDVFSFVQKIENITFPEAVRAVAQKMGVALPKQTFSSEAEAKDAKLRTVLLEIHDRACAFFQDCLRRPEGARAREYLAGRVLNEE